MSNSIPVYDPLIWKVPVVDHAGISDFQQASIPTDAIIRIGNGLEKAEFKIERLTHAKEQTEEYFLVCFPGR